MWLLASSFLLLWMAWFCRRRIASAYLPAVCLHFITIVLPPRKPERPYDYTKRVATPQGGYVSFSLSLSYYGRYIRRIILEQEEDAQEEEVIRRRVYVV